MTLVIIKESNKVRDEQIEKETMRFTLSRRIGLSTECVARIEIPADAKDLLWLNDVYISTRFLNLLTNDLKTDTDLNWFERNDQNQLVRLIWKLYDTISYCAHSVDEGFQFLSDESTPSSNSSASDFLQQEGNDIARRRAVTLLQVRNPDNIKSDIDQLRKVLFKLKKRWVEV